MPVAVQCKCFKNDLKRLDAWFLSDEYCQSPRPEQCKHCSHSTRGSKQRSLRFKTLPHLRIACFVFYSHFSFWNGCGCYSVLRLSTCSGCTVSGGGVPKHWKASICIHTWKGTGGCIPIHPMYLDYPCTHPHRCLTQAHTPLTHHQHIPPPPGCPEPIQAVMHEEAFHLHWLHTVIWLLTWTTRLLYLSLYCTAPYKAPILVPLAGRNSAAQECAPEWTRLSRKGSVTYYNSFFPAINQACSWKPDRTSIRKQTTRSLTTWARGWYQLIMLSPTCWVHSWPGCSSGKDTASLQATWEW